MLNLWWFLSVVAVASAASIQNENMSYDTIVVGLGASGTMAATTLAKSGRKVLALEAQDRVGGRVQTVQFGDGVVELGAEWIHGTVNSSTYSLAMQNNIDVRSQDISFEVYRSDGSTYNKTIVNKLLDIVIEVIDEPPEVPEPVGEFVTKKLLAYINQTYPDLLEDQDFITELLAFCDLVIDNYEASNSWNDVSTDSKYEELGGDQHMSWHRHGYKTLFELMMNTYNNGPGIPTLTTKLNTEVTKIDWPQDPAKKVVVTCKDGGVYTADNVIVTVSIGVLKAKYPTLFSPPLPNTKTDAIRNIQMGLLGKIVFEFPEDWRNEVQWFEFIWKGSEKKTVEDYWVTRIGEASRCMGSSKVLTMWTVGDTGRLFPSDGRTTPPVRRQDLQGPQALKNGERPPGGFLPNAVSRVLKPDWGAIPRHPTMFSPALPKRKMCIIDSMTIGVMDKITILFPHKWWPETIGSFYAFIWKNTEKKKVKTEDLWVTKILGASMPLGSNNVLTLWTSGETAKWVETLPEDVVKTKSMELLRMFMGANITIPEPIKMIRSTWHTNPYTRGSYTYDSIKARENPKARVDLSLPLTDNSGKPRVLFAGEATNPTHFSTVHGAVDSGLREAMRLLPSSKL